MKRGIILGLAAALALTQVGCIAVSSRSEEYRPARYHAVAMDGHIYVVDTCKRVAREVRIADRDKIVVEVEEKLSPIG